jgi:type VI secretion system protein ImpB
MAESTQHKLDRIRPPRVQITYDVEVGGAIQKKELPFVLGIMSDLSGKPENPLPRLKDRKFVEIDRDNFDEVLAATTPRLALAVPNKLANDGSLLRTELTFNKLDDFDPIAIVNQVPALKKLLDARGKLSDLLAKLDGNEALENSLSKLAGDPNSVKQIAGERTKGE